jgi:branched-chain amino acid transport system ATP-binding protein
MLRCSRLSVSYGEVEALHDVNIHVGSCETVALIGANGAGKTTLLQTISGLNKVQSGDIVFEDRSMMEMPCERRVRVGISHAPEGRRIFPGLTVAENLSLAAGPWRKWNQSIAADLDRVFDLFPRLRERRRQLGWSLSGGEQQMLAIGRALMAKPRLLMLDEPSLGLAPRLAEEVYERVKLISETGIAILVVEQNTVLALSVANRGYVLENGRIVLEGAAEELRKNPRVREAYLGR